MGCWSLQKPERDGYKSEHQFTVIAFSPPDRKILLIVSTEDTDAAFYELQSTFYGLLDIIETSTELRHPLSFLHITIGATGITEASIKLNHSFLKTLLTSVQLLDQAQHTTLPLIPFNDLRISRVLAVTFMSITFVGSFKSSSEQKFLKTLHSFNHSLFTPLRGLNVSDSSRHTSVEAL